MPRAPRDGGANCHPSTVVLVSTLLSWLCNLLTNFARAALTTAIEKCLTVWLARLLAFSQLRSRAPLLRPGGRPKWELGGAGGGSSEVSSAATLLLTPRGTPFQCACDAAPGPDTRGSDCPFRTFRNSRGTHMQVCSAVFITARTTSPSCVILSRTRGPRHGPQAAPGQRLQWGSGQDLRQCLAHLSV